MMPRKETYVRFTHMPTGLVARSNCVRGREVPYYRYPNARMVVFARKLIAAKVAMLRAEPTWREGCYPGRDRVRTYDLHPYLGIPPFVRNEGCDTRHGFSGRYDAPVTPESLDRIMLERKKEMTAP